MWSGASPTGTMSLEKHQMGGTKIRRLKQTPSSLLSRTDLQRLWLRLTNHALCSGTRQAQKH